MAHDTPCNESHYAFMRELWLQILAHNPDKVDEIEHMLRWHGGTGHFITAGTRMVNLWKNMQDQMASIS